MAKTKSKRLQGAKGTALKCALAVVAGVALCTAGVGFDWFGALSLQAVYALGVLTTCICLWVSGAFPEYLTALIMIILFVCLCGVPTQTALSAFASPTWWLLVAAFGLGLGMQRSGLLARMSHAILRVFPATFRMQAAGLIAAGTLIGPFIPSLSAKATMLAPLSLGISDSLGYERRGRAASGLFLAMFTGIRTVGPAVISASIIGYGLQATLPVDVAARFDMLHWFLAMLPWFAVVTVLNYIALVVLYEPRGSHHRTHRANGDCQATAQDGEDDGACHAQERTDATCAPSDSSSPDTHGEAPGRMSLHEREMLVIMIVCIILWMTEPIHGIGSHLVALGAFVCMMVCGIVKTKELKASIAWDSLIFIGCVLGLASVFSHLGIDTWIIGSCEPLFMALSENIYLLIACVGIVTVALRFIIVSEMAYINIFMAFMVPLSMSVGMNPWVIGVSVYAMVNPWFVLYQNPIYMTAFYATDGAMVRQGPMACYCAVYMAICLLGLMVSIPFWQGAGIL